MNNCKNTDFQKYKGGKFMFLTPEEIKRIIPEKMAAFEIQLMLHINEQLFKKNFISEDMYRHIKKQLQMESYAFPL